MKILYVAKHRSGYNDDEGAIRYALESLGHEVDCVQEGYAEVKGLQEFQADFLLCHHWNHLRALSTARMPKVYWCFDLVDWPEPVARHDQRRRWATAMSESCDLGFHTDGGWVQQNSPGKLFWLSQGADNREIAIPAVPKTVDVLFVGGLGYGREAFVESLRERYGAKFKHVERGCYGAALAAEVAAAKVVVCPPTPVKDFYWSNRVYNMLRLGAFVIHPYCKGLEQDYGDRIKLYQNVGQIHRVIEQSLLLNESVRGLEAETTQRHTKQYHTYRHRCEKLVSTIKERLCLK